MSGLMHSLTPARAIRRQRLRVDPRIMLGILLIGLAVAGGLSWAGSVNQGRGVVVATRDLSVGAIIGPGDLAVTTSRLDDRVYAAAIPADQVDSLIGQQVVEPIHGNQQLVPGQLGAGPLLAADQGAMTVAVEAEVAAGGRLKPGDQVQVIVTRDQGKPTARSEVVIERATVHSIGRDPQSRFAGAAGSREGDTPDDDAPLASVTLALTLEQRLALAQAKWGGAIDLVLLPAVPSAGAGR